MSAARPAEKVIAGTRGSHLALRQAEHVLGLLRAHRPEISWIAREFTTKGDKESESSLLEIGGKGAFTEAIEQALCSGEIAFAIHSLKDLPVDASSELAVAAVVGPRIAGEALVSRSGAPLAELPAGAVVGTSSLRRQAQLLFRRPDLRVRPIRGNVETRIEKIARGEYEATLLAAAGIERLGLGERISELLPADVMLSAPGQGAIAVQCRADDERMISLLAAIDDPDVNGCTRAERSFLKALAAGCSAPVAALAVRSDGPLERSYRLVGRVAAPDGSRMIEVSDSGGDPNELGKRLAEEALRRGAEEMLGEGRRSGATRRNGLLRGRRIVVTRPRSQAAEIAERLEREGAEVVIVPVIEIRPLPPTALLEEALARLEEFRWVVIASANAAEHFLAAVRSRRGALDSLGGRIAVVGAHTAAALSAGGVAPAFVAHVQTGAGLGQELPECEGAEVLLPCAEHHTEGLPAILAERGARVTVVPIYRTERVPIGREGIEELRRGVDFVLFTSGSTVAGFVEAVKSEADEALLERLFERAKIACLGPSTASAVRAAGFVPDTTAADHTADGLVAAVLQIEEER